MKPTNENSAAPQAVATGDLFGQWVPTAERVPANPEGFPRNDHVPCLCAWRGENGGGDLRILQWNAYYKVWDDADGDDFFCEVQEVTHWMPLPPWPNNGGVPRPENAPTPKHSTTEKL